MSLSKKPGPLLISEFQGNLEQIPPEFRAKIGIRKTDQENPLDVEPDDLVDDIVQSQVTQERTDERKKTNYELIGDLNTTLDDEIFVRELCQIGHRQRKLVPEGTDLPDPNCLLWSAEQHNLGNGLLDQIITTFDDFFTEPEYVRERGVVTPQDFRAKLQEHEESVDVCGTAGDIDPFDDGDGNISVRRHQLDGCKYRETTRVLDQLDLPQQIVNKRTNQVKQVETVTRILEDATETPATPTALRDVTFTKLGDGTALEEIVDIPSVFGHTRYARERGIVTPEDFRAQLQIHELEQTSAGTAADPTLIAGDIGRSDEQVDVFDHRTTRRWMDLLDLPVTIDNTETNRFKQQVTKRRTLELDSETPVDPTALKDTRFTVLGDGTALQEEDIIEEVFAQERFGRERPNVTPSDFAAKLQTLAYDFTEAGDAADPGPLPSGYVSIFDTQVDIFDHRLEARYVDIGDLPQQIVNRETNEQKQFVTVTRILDDESVSPPTPTALMDVTKTRLGDGTALTITKEVDEVFDQLEASIEIADGLPEIFKSIFPTLTEDYVEAGTTINDPPTLGANELRRVEKRLTEKTRRIATRSLDVTNLGTPITLFRRLGGFDFGGEHMQVIGLLDDSEPLVEDGLGVTSSEVKNLGNGLWFRQTEKFDSATEWPTLIGTEVDPRTGITIGIEKKVVDAGTTGGLDGSVYTDIKPIDKWRSIQIASSLDTGSLPDSKTWETTMEHRFPNTLLGVAFIWGAASAPYAYDFDMAMVLDMKEGYAGPCRAKITESFSNGPPSDVITPTIFCPQAHTVGYSWAFAADPSEDCGTCVGIARANARTWAIPPSLHDEIDLTGTVTLSEGEFTSSLPATSPIGLPSPGTLIVKACDVEEWRFGVFFRRLVEIYVPDCGE